MVNSVPAEKGKPKCGKCCYFKDSSCRDKKCMANERADGISVIYVES